MSKIKICGLSRKEDIDAVNQILSDYIGFVFAPSRRQLAVKTAAVLKEKLDRKIKAVGVFVNETLETVGEIYRRGIIDLVQLHGDEDSAYIRQLKKICGCPVIKAVSVGESLPALPEEADYLLFDTLSPQRGGTGKTFDWRILQGYCGQPYFLAGGISAANISDATGLLHPFCLDVSSSVETDGVKDRKKIEEIVQLVRRMEMES